MNTRTLPLLARRQTQTGVALIEALVALAVMAVGLLGVVGMQATLRTNFFQPGENAPFKSYLSFKFQSAKVPELPLPHPYAEIFVYSLRVEGIHLRGGKVARGGLRWSDRRDDFRTEVLGLVKAQQVKNAVIVPVGSKGGFVVKCPPAEEIGRAHV